MKKYIGTKQVEATPMTMGIAYDKCLLHRDTVLCAGDRHKDGYYLLYENGYESWCPKDEFEKTYRPILDECGNMCFGDAIEVLKQGGAVRRKGWNGKGLFVVKQVPAHIESEVISRMQSLPQSAKDLILNGKGFIDYSSQCLIYNEKTGRADSWTPSIADVFSEDWEIVL